jgi:hypothetical protein
LNKLMQNQFVAWIDTRMRLNLNCADGEPYVNWWELQRCRQVLKALGDPEPQLPKVNQANHPPLPWEEEFRAYLAKKKAKKRHS